jgi:hypothetical protein
MQEDVVPLLAAELEKENVTDVELVWENNEVGEVRLRVNQTVNRSRLL